MPTKIMKKYLTFFCLLLLALLGNSKTNADIASSANGEWQYLIRRGDTKGTGGTFLNPNCPFYVGYFRLDYDDFYPDKKGRYILDMRKGDFQAIKGKGKKRYLVGKNSYEIKGSYTPYDSNEYCSNPPTNAQREKAPLFMEKISDDGRKLEWYIDFLQGSSAQNALWKVKAEFNGKDKIEGILKAYVCADQNRQKCSLINTAHFEAKKIKSIQEASGKALFKSKGSISLLKQLFQVGDGVFEDKQVYADTLDISESSIKPEHIKPSLLSMFPAKADPLIGLKICRAKGGEDNGFTCKVCRNVGCAGGQIPTKEEQGICYGNNDGQSVCQCDCGNCVAATLRDPCQSL